MKRTGDIISGIKVFKDDFGRVIRISPYREIVGDYDLIVYLWENGKWNAKEYKMGEEVNTNELITISLQWAESLRDGLIELLGYPEPTATKQKLEATEKHLEDMRKLVFESRIIREGTPECSAKQ